ncbi:hypothetical protein B0H16DRAFT_1478054 [Mycena metata]|uniref:Uncharacterized protein n=1 Tax=Mycena metata TaxID=1033252 RepID=A0AAD7H8V0_9AGAR|nr:hypothetical protein B0H16DRAFT_1478054 [Mycena metata]
MARFISLFYAVVAAVTAASAAAVQERDSILATFFIDIDFSGPAYGHRRPAYWLPHASPEFAGSVSSVKIATGVKCTLWNEPECTGGSITLAADTPDLGALGFNDLDCLDGFRQMPPQLRVCFLCTWKVLKKLGHCTPGVKWDSLFIFGGRGGGGGGRISHPDCITDLLYFCGTLRRSFAAATLGHLTVSRAVEPDGLLHGPRTSPRDSGG